MSLTKRIGTILKEAREARKLTIGDVSRETNIIPKYIDALEKEDYSCFPGETYALGFLRSYTEYLNLDTQTIIDLYRGHQIDQVETPVKELTRPLHAAAIPGLDFLLRRTNINMIVAAFAGIAVIVLFIYGIIQFPSLFEGTTKDVSSIESVCNGRESLPVALPGRGSSPITENLSMENSVMFVVDTLNIKLCLVEIKKSTAGEPVGKFQIQAGDDAIHEFLAREGETVSLDSSIDELSEISREIRMMPSILGDVSARVELASGDAENAPATGIRVTLQFIDTSYLEWTDDGKSHRGVTISSGETKVFEATNRLEIKVGNGGGVRILRDGEPPRIAGPRGKIVKMSYRMAPDPLDPGMSRVVESVEVQ